LLRDLQGGSTAASEAALETLFTNIWHQGGVFTATAPAVPFLVDHAEHPGTGQRVDTLRLLYEIADNACLDDAIGQSARSAVLDETPRLLRLLSDDDPEVSAFAAWLLATLPEKAKEYEQTLEPVAKAGHPVSKAGALFTLGKLRSEVAPAVAKQAAEDGDPLIRYVAALVLCSLDLGELQPGAVELLVDHLVEPRDIGYGKLPFGWDDDVDATAALRSHPGALKFLIERPKSRRPSRNRFRVLLDVAFPGPNAERRSDDLTDDQRAVIDWVTNVTASAGDTARRELEDDLDARGLSDLWREAAEAQQ
jgi:hypothetical protein